MAQMQHYVPVSILRQFAAPEAWKLVPPIAQENTRFQDERVLNGDNHREWPVCHFTLQGRYSRRIIKKVFAEKGLYSIRVPVGRLDRAMIHLALRVLHDGRLDSVQDTAQFFKLEEQALDPDVVESTHLSRLDNDFAKLADQIRSGAPVSRDQFAILLKLVTLQRFRTPGWKDCHFPDAIKRLQAHMEHSTRDFEATFGSSPTLGLPQDVFYAQLYRHLHQLTIMKFTTDPMDYLLTAGVKATLLIPAGEVPFICSDNPMRPYCAARPKRIRYDRPLGIEKPGIAALLPLGPKHCLRFEVNAAAQAIPIPKRTLQDDEVRTVNTALLYSSYQAFICNSPRDDLFESAVNLNMVKRPKIP
jgi:hypothetical protein